MFEGLQDGFGGFGSGLRLFFELLKEVFLKKLEGERCKG